MMFEVVLGRRRLATIFSLGLITALSVFGALSSQAANSVTIAWNSSTSPQVVGYNVYYGPASGSYTNILAVGNVTSATISNLAPGAAYYFSAKAVDIVGLESDFSNEAAFTNSVVAPPNQPPTLNSIANVTVTESAGSQTVNLSGITSGATNEAQTLTVTAASGNTSLIPNPTVSYTSPNSTGSISFTPVPFASGNATITVRVNDGGASNNIVTRTFTVTVIPVNQSPTLNAIGNVTIVESAGSQTVNLSGITSGATNEAQTLTVTATSGNTALIPNPTVSYTSPNTTGSLSFTPVPLANGTATITVTVNDGGASNNIVTRTFNVAVTPVNQLPTLNSLANLSILEGAGLQTVSLAGITSGASNETQTLTVTASSSNTGLIPNPTVSYTSPNTTGSISFTPVPLANGTSTITVTVNDGGASNNVVTRVFTVTVNSVNQAPTLNSLSNVNINESAGLQTVSLSGITSGASNELQTLTVSATSDNTALVPNPAVSYTSPSSTGSISFTPVPLANGTATITVTVNDGGASNNVVTRSFAVTVNSVNQVPTLNSLANVNINESAGLQTVNLSGITSGASNEVQTLTVSATSDNTALIPNPAVSYTSPSSTGSISFTPVPLANGTATITVTVNDGGASNNVVTRTFTVTVNPVNQAPTLNSLANVNINESAGLQTVNLSGITSGASNEIQTLTVAATSDNTALIPNPAVSYTSPSSTGSISFTPVPLANGTATITLTVNDGAASNNVVTRTFTVTVNPVNQAPTLNSIANVNINENAGLQTVSLSGITSGASNEVQTLTVSATSDNTALIPNPAVSYTSPSSTGSLSFTPAPAKFGSANITVTVNDAGASNNVVTRSFTVTVNPVNQAPTLNSIANLNINENAGLQTVNLSGITSGASNEVQTLTVSATSDNTALIANPAVSYTSPSSTGSLSFTPVPTTFGSANITVTVNDGGASNNVVTRSFTVIVNPVNQLPTLNSIANLTVNENAGLQTVNLSGITAGASNEVQTLTVTATSDNISLIPNPAVSYTSPNSTGSISFTPVPTTFGSATITVKVNDGGASNNVVSRSFTVTVGPVNQAPTLNSLANVNINENAGLQTVNLSGITAGASNEIQTLTVTATSDNTALIPNPAVSYTSPSSTGSLSFTPAPTTFGSANITVTVNDGGASNNVVSRSFTVTVGPVNQAPTLNSLANVNINENAGLQTVNLSGITSGASNEIQTLAVTATSDNTALIPNPAVSYTSPSSTGSLSFTPAPTTFGSANITVTVNDGGASNNVVTRTFSVAVNPVNQLPTLNSLANVNINENAGLQTVNLSGITSGASNEVQTLTVTATSDNTSLIPNPAVSYTSPNSTGSISFTPAPTSFGSANITVTVNDGGASNNVVSRSFTVTVGPVNQQPTLSSIASLTINEDAGLQTVNLSGITAGASNEVQTLTVTATSDNTSVIPNPAVNYVSPSSAGSLSFTPVPMSFGTATITVTVNDGGASNNVVTRSFTVTVDAVNQPPTLNSIANVAISQNAGLQTVNLSGITSGASNEVQTLTVTATSDNTSLIADPAVSYTSPSTTGSLSFTPVPTAYGTATITVTVNDGAGSNNIVTRSFTVSVGPVNQPPTLNSLAKLTVNENAGPQSVNLSGITSGSSNEVQTLTVTATSDNTSLIPNPTVSYTSPNSTGLLSFASVTNEHGAATLTVTVNDGGASNNVVTRSFQVTINGLPTISTITNRAIAVDTQTQPIPFTIGDAETPADILFVAGSSSNTNLVLDAGIVIDGVSTNRTVTVTPLAGQEGIANIVLMVSDGMGTNTSTFQLSVMQRPAPPGNFHLVGP